MEQEKNKNPADETTVNEPAANESAENVKDETVNDKKTEETAPPDDKTADTASGKTAQENAEGDDQPDGKKAQKELKKLKAELEKTKSELEKQKGEAKDQNDRYMRMMAEYDNFRKRAAKEREGVYADAYSDLLKQILPVLDNLERAETACKPTDADGNAAEADVSKISEGISLTLKSFRDVLAKIGVEEIDAQGKPFDPSLHNAVMHVESDEHDEGTVVDVFQKGYKKGDKVIRYAMVKVAN